MSGQVWRVQRQVHDAWIGAVDAMKMMSRASSVRPEIPSLVFKIDQEVPLDVIKLRVTPVVFNVPERANSKGANLYIVATGWLTFEATEKTATPLKTRDFGTKVAYFLQKENKLEHVYGVHYDMDDGGKGHPIFHAHIRSQIDIGRHIETQFNVEDETIDQLGKVMRSVRTPTAQMDLFSVLTQICADHLIWNHSSREVKRAFDRTRKICNFFVGAAHRVPFLHEKRAIGCYRATHWYGPGANDDNEQLHNA